MSSTDSRRHHACSPEIDAAHFGIGAHLLGRALGQLAALVEHGDLLRDAEHHRHVMLGEQQRQAALGGDALQQGDGFVGFARRHPGGGFVQQQHASDRTPARCRARAASGCRRPACRRSRSATAARPIVASSASASSRNSVSERDQKSRPRPAMGEQRRLHVLQHGQAREDVGELERSSHAQRADAVRRQPGDVAPVQHHASGVGAQMAR